MWDRIFTTTASTSGPVLTREAFDRFIDHLKESNTGSPWLFEVSSYAFKRIRHLERWNRMCEVHPKPRYKIRKCHMCKLVEKRRRYKAHIARVERAEEARAKI